MFTRERTASKSARDPPKRRLSVNTLITLAPAFSYCSAKLAGSAIVASAPLLGEERLTSAITESSLLSNVFKGSRTGAAVSIASCS